LSRCVKNHSTAQTDQYKKATDSLCRNIHAK
jgi:hypothetical protein